MKFLTCENYSTGALNDFKGYLPKFGTRPRPETVKKAANGPGRSLESKLK